LQRLRAFDREDHHDGDAEPEERRDPERKVLGPC
jgi:hypothetical protein